MPHYRCLTGHLWEDIFDASFVDGMIRCPLCGESSIEETEVSQEGVGRSTQVKTCMTARVANSSEQRQGLKSQEERQVGATVVRPALANMPAQPGPPNSAEAPVSPSERIPYDPATSATVDGPSGEHFAAPPCKVKEWPSIPGYEILGELGRGGMGVVYKARQVQLNRVVALKMILSGSAADERERARFHTEARAVARLSHPSIVQIFDVGEHQGSAYFSLEYVSGGSLADRLRGQPMPVAEAARLVEKLAGAVQLAHEHGVIHRDIKPANVLLQEEASRRDAEGAEKGAQSFPALSAPSASLREASSSFVPKLTDFGLAKTMDNDVHTTRSGMVVGTPAYMAPEQALGHGVVTPATDIYALGVMLYQLVTARLPFVGDTPMDVMVKVTQQEPPPPSRYAPRLARDLETIILKCLEKDPRRRYASAAELAEDLRRFLAHEPILARPIGRTERLWRWARRRPALSGMMAVVALCLVGLAASWGVHAHRAHRRLAQAHEEGLAVLLRARGEAEKGKWEEVRGLKAALDGAVREGALAEHAAEVEALGARAEGMIAAREKLQGFEQERDEALFHAVLFLAGGAQADHEREATRRKVERALARVGASPRQGPPRDAFFTTEEEAEVRRGCYELLLVLADLQAQSRPDEAPEQRRTRARQALGVLGTAAGLGLQTHAFHLRRARFLEQAEQPADASKERAEAKRHPPDSYLDHYLAGRELYTQGKSEAAATCFVAALRRKPDHFWARYFLAMCHVQLGKLDAAREALTSCEAQKKGLVWLYLLRGHALGRMGCYADAEADFATALTLLEKQPNAEALYALYNNRAVARLGKPQKDYAGAQRDLEMAATLQPDQYLAHLTLRQVLLEQNKPAEAEAALDQALAAADRLFARKGLDAGTLVMLRRHHYRAHLQRKDHDAALAELDAMLALPGLEKADQAKLQRDRGHLLFRAGKRDDALAAYDAALRAAPNDTAILRWRAELLLAQKRYPEAEKGFGDYLRRGGKPLARIYRGRALARVQMDQHQAAVTDFTLALALEPDDVSLRLQRGRTYLACQAWKLAAADFDAVLQRDAGSAVALQGRGLARLHLGLVRQAGEDAEQLAVRAGQDSSLLFGAACLLAQVSGQINSASAGAVRRQRQHYQERAVALLRQVIDRLPAEQRAAFWRKTVQGEETLKPLWSHVPFTQLERLYGQGG
jgi:serine/threonine protein kinase/tetratricopeptide (TPR) repeat protein